MFAIVFHIALLALLFLAMAAGGLLTIGGSYAAFVYKGNTRAAELLNALCWALAIVGLIIFVLAAAHFVPLVMR